MNTAFRFVYPFLTDISRGLGISLTKGGLLVSARSPARAATPTIVASVGRGNRHRRALLVDKAGDKAGPARLIGGTEAGPVVAIEVLVKQHGVSPMRLADLACTRYVDPAI